MTNNTVSVTGTVPESEVIDQPDGEKVTTHVDLEDVLDFMETLMEEDVGDTEKVERFMEKFLVGCEMSWEDSTNVDIEECTGRKDSFMRVKIKPELFWRGKRLVLRFPMVLTSGAIMSRLSLLQKFLHLLDRRQKKIAMLKEGDNVTRETVAMLIHNARGQMTGVVGAVELVSLAATRGDLEEVRPFIISHQDQLKQTLRSFSQTTALAMRLAMSDERFEPRCQTITIETLRDEIEKQQKDHLLIMDETMASADELAVDMGLFHQILDNIAVNALKYGHTRGVPLVIRLQKVDEDFLQFEVEDRGDGFIGPSEYLFEVGYRAEQSRQVVAGHGLGLAFCKRMVEKMGGKVFAFNNPGGKGSTFGFTLPFKK